MRAFLDCVPCLVSQCLRAARLATSDPELQARALRAVMGYLQRADLSGSPIEISLEPHRLVREVTGCVDPYAPLKAESNAKALRHYARLKEVVRSSDNPLLTAVRIAAAGNIMDFGALASFDVEATLDRALTAPFGIDHSRDFRQAVESARRVLYLLDNAGEIVFDRILIEELAGKHVTAAVKSDRFINDAMLEDARAVGLDQVAEIVAVPPADISPAPFAGAWEAADLIIAKGQANFEAFRDVDGPIFFLLIIKCPVLAADAGAQAGDLVLQSRALAASHQR